MMCPAIDNSARCEICTVIHFLYTKNMSAAESHHELCMVVYGQNVMSEETVRQWCRMLKNVQVNKCAQ
jgi:hypothetical protein